MRRVVVTLGVRHTQELDLSRCSNLTDAGLERMCNRLHLWVPRLHTLNVAGCASVSDDVLKRIVLRRPVRGSVVVDREGGVTTHRQLLLDAPSTSYVVPPSVVRGGGGGGDSSRSGGSVPEVDDVGTGSRGRAGAGAGAGVGVGASPPRRGADPAAAPFVASPSKRGTPLVMTYDGTKVLAKSKHPAMVRAPPVEPVGEAAPKPGWRSIGPAAAPIARWGRGAEGTKGADHKHWVPDAAGGMKWLPWARLTQGPARGRDGEDDAVLRPLEEMSDEAVMQAVLGSRQPGPALLSCVETAGTFVGITWDAKEIEALKRSRCVGECGAGPRKRLC